MTSSFAPKHRAAHNIRRIATRMFNAWSDLQALGIENPPLMLAWDRQRKFADRLEGAA